MRNRNGNRFQIYIISFGAIPAIRCNLSLRGTKQSYDLMAPVPRNDRISTAIGAKIDIIINNKIYFKILN